MRRRMLLEGETLRFNQLVQNGNFESTSGWSTMRCSLQTTGNVGVVTAEEFGADVYAMRLMFYSVAYANRNSYLFTCDISPSHSLDVEVKRVGDGSTSFVDKTLNANVWDTVSAIHGGYSDANGIWIGLGAYSPPYTVGDTIQIRNVMIINLTAMYGAGNEPTTVAQVKADCAAIGHPLTEYQPYTPIT